MFSFLYIQTLYNDLSHIEDVHFLFCAPFINMFSFLGGGGLNLFFLFVQNASMVSDLCCLYL